MSDSTNAPDFSGFDYSAGDLSAINSGGGGGGGNSNWFSGLTGFLTAIGTTVTNVSRSLSPPKAGTTLYNPQTGVPYGIDPRTGQPTVPTQTSQLLNVAAWVVIAIVAVWAIKSIKT